MTETIDLKNWFVLYDGPKDDGTDSESTPLAASGTFEQDIRNEFKESIQKGFADKDRGLFLVRLSDVADEQIELLSDEDELEKVIAGGFKGFNVEVVEVYKTDLSDWNSDAVAEVGDLDEGETADADGFVRYYSN